METRISTINMTGRLPYTIRSMSHKSQQNPFLRHAADAIAARTTSKLVRNKNRPAKTIRAYLLAPKAQIKWRQPVH